MEILKLIDKKYVRAKKNTVHKTQKKHIMRTTSKVEKTKKLQLRMPTLQLSPPTSLKINKKKNK